MLVSTVFVLLLVGVTSATAQDAAAAEEEPYYRYEEEPRYSGYRERKYTEYERARGPTTEPLPVREMFGVRRWDIDDIVDTVDGDEESGPRYQFTEGVIRAVEEDVIPELCYLNSENLTIYNSFLLDRQCLEAMESVSPDCRGFKCELAHYFLNNGAQIFMDFFNAESYKDGLKVIHKELSAAFKELKMCTCGREFFKAVFKCAPYYHSNALFALVENDEDSIVAYGKVARNVDLRSFSRFFDRLMGGLCAESSQGMCLDSIFNGAEELLDMVLTTVDDYEAYDDGDKKFRKSQEKRCDALFGPIQAWNKDDMYLDWDDGEDFWELLFNKTGAVANEFYCEKRCRKTRGPMYPCCMRRMMEDEKMFDNVARVIESVYQVIPATTYDFQWEGFYELDSYFRRDYPEEELERIMAWTVPDQIRNAFMRTVHGAKYCAGKTVKCSK